MPDSRTARSQDPLNRHSVLVGTSTAFRRIDAASIRSGALLSSGLSRVVIGLHDRSRNEFACMRAIWRAYVRERLLDEQTIILVPCFADSRRSGSPTTWDEQWMSGGRSSRGVASTVSPLSSFDVVDDLLSSLVTSASPPPTEVVLIGHSAGGQFLNRYCLTSSLLEQVAQQTKVRVLISAPSSFLYLTPDRPLPDGRFGRPPEERRGLCPTYNDYKYGLENMPVHLPALTAETAISRHRKLQVLYCVGENDNRLDDATAANSMAALLQGATRVERMLAYIRHIVGLGGFPTSGGADPWIVPDVGHALEGILADPRLGRWLAAPIDPIQTIGGLLEPQPS